MEGALSPNFLLAAAHSVRCPCRSARLSSADTLSGTGKFITCGCLTLRVCPYLGRYAGRATGLAVSSRAELLTAYTAPNPLRRAQVALAALNPKHLKAVRALRAAYTQVHQHRCRLLRLAPIVPCAGCTMCPLRRAPVAP